MSRIRKFLHLSLIDQRLIIKSVFLLVAIKIGLSLLSFKTLLSFLDRIKQESIGKESNQKLSLERTVWAVGVASKYVPLATCLTRALATQVLLAQQGYSTSLHIGVAKGKEGQLEAHAWVESQGQIIIGGLEALSRFSQLPLFKEGKP
jgi:hypothetical protein